MASGEKSLCEVDMSCKRSFIGPQGKDSRSYANIVMKWLVPLV